MQPPTNHKFRIIFEDNTHFDSHNEKWEQLGDHANALAPHNKKKWKEYQLISKDGFMIAVGFLTGAFHINGVIIHPATDNGTVLTNLKDEQEFPVSKPWQLLNGLPYYPVVGRRQLRGFTINMTIPFCGWKKKFKDKTYEKVAFLYPNNQVVMQ